MGGHAMTGKQTEDEAFVLEHRRELALAYMRRADESATVLRTVLLTVCSAAIGFIFYQRAATHAPRQSSRAHLFWRRGKLAVEFPVIPVSSAPLKANALILLGSRKFFAKFP
jgi:hypothetical protein